MYRTYNKNLKATEVAIMKKDILYFFKCKY